MNRTDTIYLHTWWDISLEYHPTKPREVLIEKYEQPIIK